MSYLVNSNIVSDLNLQKEKKSNSLFQIDLQEEKSSNKLQKKQIDKLKHEMEKLHSKLTR